MFVHRRPPLGGYSGGWPVGLERRFPRRSELALYIIVDLPLLEPLYHLVKIFLYVFTIGCCEGLTSHFDTISKFIYRGFQSTFQITDTYKWVRVQIPVVHHCLLSKTRCFLSVSQSFIHETRLVLCLQTTVWIRDAHEALCGKPSKNLNIWHH